MRLASIFPVGLCLGQKKVSAREGQRSLEAKAIASSPASDHNPETSELGDVEMFPNSVLATHESQESG